MKEWRDREEMKDGRKVKKGKKRTIKERIRNNGSKKEKEGKKVLGKVS
jgi:hypothetical protein